MNGFGLENGASGIVFIVECSGYHFDRMRYQEDSTINVDRCENRSSHVL
jgi:hypothetical protein